MAVAATTPSASTPTEATTAFVKRDTPRFVRPALKTLQQARYFSSPKTRQYELPDNLSDYSFLSALYFQSLLLNLCFVILFSYLKLVIILPYKADAI